MTDKIEIVYELTREEALALVVLIGNYTKGNTAYKMYQPLWRALGDDHEAVLQEAQKRFPLPSLDLNFLRIE